MSTDLALTNGELTRLDECERTIERGLRTFTEVGRALMDIRDSRLYRSTHGTFEDYCAARWNISRPRAYQLIEAADAVSTIVDTGLPAPTNEGQARELARVPEDLRAEVWQQTLEATDGKPTAAAIRDTYEPTPEPEPDPLPEPIAEEIHRRIAEKTAAQPELDRDPMSMFSQEEIRLLALVQDGHTVVASLRGQHDNLIQWAMGNGRYVRIDRRTEWGNPFELPADGDRDTVIANYRDHYLPHKPSLLAKLPDLRGKALGCWCAPEPCHGDVLKAAAEC